MALLDVKDASFSYIKGKLVFKNINFSVNNGEIFCIVGPNGCGKTTLIDSILSVHKLDSGKILLNDQDIKTLKPQEIAAELAYVPQSHQKTFPYTVLDVVVMGRTYKTGLFSSPDGEDKDIAIKSLEMVGLTGFEDRLYTELSGGELQLVLLARALTQQSKLIVMDEPTAHLDFRHEQNVIEIIIKLAKEQGMTILMATHFLNEVFYLENSGVKITVALMNNGKFIEIGAPTKVLNEKNLYEVYGITTRVLNYKEDDNNYKYLLAMHKRGDDNA